MFNPDIICTLIERDPTSDYAYRGEVGHPIMQLWVDIQRDRQQQTEKSQQLHTVDTYTAHCRYQPQVQPGMQLIRNEDRQRFNIVTAVNLDDESIWTEMVLTHA